MELPEDVLAIVRAYSKPVFKYYKEYNRTLKLNYLDEWTTLKEKINEEIIPHLMAYQRAMEEWRLALRQENIMEIGSDFNRMVLSYERNRRKYVSQTKKYAMNKKFHTLTLMLYGEEIEPYQLRDHSKLNAWK